jgi:hypothetical protein
MAQKILSVYKVCITETFVWGAQVTYLKEFQVCTKYVLLRFVSKQHKLAQ